MNIRDYDLNASFNNFLLLKNIDKGNVIIALLIMIQN